MKIVNDITVIISERDVTHIKNMIDTVNTFRSLNQLDPIEYSIDKSGMFSDRMSLMNAAVEYDNAAIVVHGEVNKTVSNYARYIASSGIDHPRIVKYYNEYVQSD